MSKHSKNQNAKPYLSNQEKTKLQYGTIKQRLGKDSLKRFDSCFLCLQTLISPLSCPKGHLACKECFYENIIAQKNESTRLNALYESQQSLKAQEVQLELESKKKLEITEFEKLQSSVTLQMTADSPSTVVDPIRGDLTKINAYWIPENAPQAKASFIEKPSSDLYCTAAKEKHVISLKRLIPVQFTESKNGSMSQKICPCCSKELTNAMTLVLLKQCGHVICGNCVDQFVKKSLSCIVCEDKCKEKDMIQIQSEGTGYTLKGGVQGIKHAQAFQ